MDQKISIREGVRDIELTFDGCGVNYPGMDRDFLIARGRSFLKGEFVPVYRTLQQVWYAQQQSRVLCAYNEFAQCALDNRVNYVTGEKGFGVEAAPRKAMSGRMVKLCDKVQDFIEAFEEMNSVDEMISESQMRFDRDGEYFVRLFYQKGGMTQLRFVEPEHVYNYMGDSVDPAFTFGIQTPPDDVTTPLAYWINPKPWYTSETEPVEAKYVVHVKNNVPMNSKRGIPTFLSVGPNLLRCEDLLGSMTQIAKTRAKVALIRKMMNVDKQTAESLIDRITKKRVNGYSQEVTNVEEMKPGSILTSGSNVDYQFPDYKFGADDFVEVLQAELRAIASRFKMSEWMFSALADAKYNNAFIVEAPSSKEFGRLQRIHHKAWVTNRVGWRRSIYWRAVLWAVKSGLLPSEVPTAIKLVPNGPVIVSRDKKAEAEVNKTYYDMGLRDGTSIQHEQGINPDEVLQNRISEVRSGIMTIPLQSVQQITTTLSDIAAGKIGPDAGYGLISLLLGVPKDVVREVYPVSYPRGSIKGELADGTETTPTAGSILSGN